MEILTLGAQQSAINVELEIQLLLLVGLVVIIVVVSKVEVMIIEEGSVKIFIVIGEMLLMAVGAEEVLPLTIIKEVKMLIIVGFPHQFNLLVAELLDATHILQHYMVHTQAMHLIMLFPFHLLTEVVQILTLRSTVPFQALKVILQLDKIHKVDMMVAPVLFPIFSEVLIMVDLLLRCKEMLNNTIKIAILTVITQELS